MWFKLRVHCGDNGWKYRDTRMYLAQTNMEGGSEDRGWSSFRIERKWSFRRANKLGCACLPIIKESSKSSGWALIFSIHSSIFPFCFISIWMEREAGDILESLDRFHFDSSVWGFSIEPSCLEVYTREIRCHDTSLRYLRSVFNSILSTGFNF